MKPIGGYFGLECGNTPMYYSDGIYLNNCRNAIRYFIKAFGIRQIHIPFYTCHVVEEAIAQEKCKVLKYHLDKNLMPLGQFPKNDFIIYNNYFGVLGKNIDELTTVYPNLIIDNAQAFYSTPECRAAVYSPRKFFGLPDGGILRGNDIPDLHLEIGQSINVTSHLLKRIEFGAQAGYPDFITNDSELDKYPIQTMSRLTQALMGNINYEGIKSKRLDNFNYLRNHLNSDFPIAMSCDDVPLVYPFMIENGSEIREALINKNIFCARYWPNVMDTCSTNSLEYGFARNIIALPIDQRYGEEDMNRIIDVING